MQNEQYMTPKLPFRNAGGSPALLNLLFISPFGGTGALACL